MSGLVVRFDVAQMCATPPAEGSEGGVAEGTQEGSAHEQPCAESD